MRSLFVTAVALALASCSSCDEKKEAAPDPSPAVAQSPSDPNLPPGVRPGMRNPNLRRMDPGSIMAARHLQLNGKNVVIKPGHRFVRMAGQPPLPPGAGEGPLLQDNGPATPEPAPATPGPAPTNTPAPTPATGTPPAPLPTE